MDDILISLTIGRTALLALGLLLPLVTGAGMVMAILMRMMRGSGCGG
ncbi:MAG: hypothetical protein ABFC89_05735 [Methanospirillum sp.]